VSDHMVIFTRTFDFLTWLLPVSNRFPTAHRHTFTRRLKGDSHFGSDCHLEKRDILSRRQHTGLLEKVAVWQDEDFTQ
jgi:hypothetical protein